jgi:hypothetical protein
VKWGLWYVLVFLINKMLKKFFTIGFRAKNSMTRVIPKAFGNVPIFDI